MDLQEYTYYLLRQVPQGRVTTYGHIARALGDTIASRFVGYAMALNPHAPEVPCHRVVLSDGTVGRYSSDGGVRRKIELLMEEGVKIRSGKVVNFEKIVFKDFKTEYPLKRLRRIQMSMSKKVLCEDKYSKLDIVGAIDVSYKEDTAYGACVIYALNGEKYDVIFEKRKTDFPYIPTYFVFRESPIIKELIKKCRNLVDLFIIDGNGILHPMRIGIASHVGVEMSVPTMGIAKKLLCGTLHGNKVILNDKFVGECMNFKKKILYISPGHLISLGKCVDIVKQFMDMKIYPWQECHAFATAFRKGKFHVSQ